MSSTDSFSINTGIVLANETVSPPIHISVLRPASFLDARWKALTYFPHIYQIQWALAVTEGERVVELTEEAYDVFTRNKNELKIILSRLVFIQSPTENITLKPTSLLEDEKDQHSSSARDLLYPSIECIRNVDPAVRNTDQALVGNKLEYPPQKDPGMAKDESFGDSKTCDVKYNVNTEAFPIEDRSRHEEVSIVWAKYLNWPWWPAMLYYNAESVRIPGDIRREWQRRSKKTGSKLYIVRILPLNKFEWGFVTAEQIGQYPIGVDKEFDKNLRKKHKKYLPENRRVWTKFEPWNRELFDTAYFQGFKRSDMKFTLSELKGAICH